MPECLNCNNTFHYCSSCGYYAELDANCCTPECLKEYIEKQIGNNNWDYIAEHFYKENAYFLNNARILNLENRNALGRSLVDYILSTQ